MASQVEICNMALSHIGASAIVSIGENSKEAEKCRLFFDNCLEAVLSDGNWQFRRQTKRLTLIDQEKVSDKLIRPTNWSYMYAYPSDVIKVIGVMPDYREYINFWYDNELDHYEGFQEFEIMQGKNDKVIVTNVCDAIACFSLKTTDITQLSDTLVTAFSHHLASKISMPIVGGREGRAIKKDNEDDYKEAIRTAKTHDISQKNINKKHSPIYNEYE